MDIKTEYALKSWVPLMGIVISAMGLIIGLGYCVPTGKSETIAAAVEEHRTLRAETSAQIKVLTEQQAAINAANEKDHEAFRADLKNLGEQTNESAKEILRAQIRMMEKLDSIIGAPTGPTFHRGRRD